jgi:hypothetical protein
MLWTCPINEKIAYIRTGSRPGDLFVLTKKGSVENSQWTLRLLGENGKAKIVAAGSGLTSPVNAIALSQDGCCCLIGWHHADCTDGFQATYCNLITGQQRDIKGFSSILCRAATEPFSPDGKWLIFQASKGGYAESRRLYFMNIVTGAVKPIPNLPMGAISATWTKDDELAVFFSKTGAFYRGKLERLSLCGKFRPSWHARIALDGFTINMMTKEHQLLRVNTRAKIERILRVPGVELSRYREPLEFQCAEYSGEMTLNLMSIAVDPVAVYIAKDGKCRNVVLDKSSSSMISCGLAIWKPGEVAYVERRSDNAPDRVVVQSMN